MADLLPALLPGHRRVDSEQFTGVNISESRVEGTGEFISELGEGFSGI
jgi:hypothetical protein